MAAHYVSGAGLAAYACLCVAHVAHAAGAAAVCAAVYAHAHRAHAGLVCLCAGCVAWPAVVPWPASCLAAAGLGYVASATCVAADAVVLAAAACQAV